MKILCRTHYLQVILPVVYFPAGFVNSTGRYFFSYRLYLCALTFYFLEANDNETIIAEIEKMKLIHIFFWDEQCR
ncbi:hypothetical protein ACJIZ3_005489 [Penstemon smallii]|uniref:Uncharacterized protein n=1 Tax=Penstemon smallii TaxID=265156 RepID=A0ABD3S563_9LAMI